MYIGLREDNWDAWRRRQKLFRVRSAKVLFRCKAILFNFCPLREFTTTLITWKIAWSSCLQLILSISSLFIYSSGCHKNVLLEFSEKNYRGNMAFWEEVLFPDPYFFCLYPSCHVLEKRCAEMAVSKQRLVFVDF